jgi:hypothetical protein
MGLGSEIWDPEKTYSGSLIQGQKMHRIRIRKTAYAVLCRTISWAGCGTATRLSRQRTGISGFSSGSAREETSGEVPQVGPNQRGLKDSVADPDRMFLGLLDPDPDPSII